MTLNECCCSQNKCCLFKLGFLHYTVFDMAMLLNIMMCIIIVLFSSSVQFNKEFMLYKCF